LERTGAVNEAIEEYRLATQKEPGNEETWLRYADALRRVGRTEEATEIYQKLSSSSDAEIARAAKAELGAQTGAQTVQNGETQTGARNANRVDERGANSSAYIPPTTTQQGAPQPSANGNSRETVTARPKNDPVTSYTTAMKIIEGKDIRKMNRADLIRAYELFQYAQSGPNGADAARHLRELDKELFERRKRK
jgi:tetratricopeptide (TPR) repeat protein